MKIINFIRITFTQAFYAWAEREIDKTHPDLPQIVVRRHELADEARSLFT